MSNYPDDDTCSPAYSPTTTSKPILPSSSLRKPPPRRTMNASRLVAQILSSDSTQILSAMASAAAAAAVSSTMNERNDGGGGGGGEGGEGGDSSGVDGSGGEAGSLPPSPKGMKKRKQQPKKKKDNNNNESDSTTTSAKNSNRTFDPARYWRALICRVLQDNAFAGTRPMFPIERVQEIKSVFSDPQNPTETRELTEDAFVVVFRAVLDGRMYSDEDLRRWFRDIDVDCSDEVSWDEFTSFMIYQASSFGEDNHRSRELMPNLFPPGPPSCVHKEMVRRIITHPHSPYV